MHENQDQPSKELVITNSRELAEHRPGGPLPALINETGRAGQTAWDDFFAVRFQTNIRDWPTSELSDIS